jgi:hypothetical protein
VPNPPLTVSVTNGLTVDWYDQPTGGTRLASGTPSITPATTNAGTHIYYAEARDILAGCTSLNRTPVALVLQNCSQPLSINLSNRNVILQWYGDLALQTSFALASSPSASVWTTLTNGVAGVTNYFTVAATNSHQYFRLRIPGSSGTPVLSIGLIKNQIVLEWIGNRTLQSTPALANPPGLLVWTNVLDGILGQTNLWTNEAAGRQGYFRLAPPVSP